MYKKVKQIKFYYAFKNILKIITRDLYMILFYFNLTFKFILNVYYEIVFTENLSNILLK